MSQKSKNLRGIIFDMDGVLIDSEPHSWRAINQVLEKEGYRFNDSEVKIMMGMSMRDILNKWKEKTEKDYNLKDFVREADIIEENAIKSELKPNEHIRNLIENAKKNNIRIGVATSSGRERAINFLSSIQLLDIIDTLVTSEDVHLHKPNPDIFLETARKLKVPAYSYIVIEDAPKGIAAAKKSNMKIITLKTEYYIEEDLKEADLIINDLSDLNLEMLKKTFTF